MNVFFFRMLCRSLVVGMVSGTVILASACTQERAVTSREREECVAVHAAYDVGSSTTKVTVARVDRCAGKVLEVLMKKNESVGYQDDLQRSERNELSEEIRQQGAEVLAAFQAAAREHEPSVEVGVATAAFREAANGMDFLKSLRDRTGVDLRIIDGREEAILGFRAAVVATGIPSQRAVVWDIGGGSMQVIALDVAGNREPADAADGGNDDPQFLYFEGNTASVPFRDQIIGDLQQQDLAKTRSPNPVTAEIVSEALELSRELASDIPPALAERLSDPATTVIGIGGVHYFSVRGQLDSGDEPYSRDEVAELLDRRKDMSDEQIGGSFADTEVSNLILVLGHMEAWGLETVQPARISLDDGLLLTSTSSATAASGQVRVVSD